jgi:class 3 adenylate cyclase
VIIASRIADEAKGGQILVSALLKELTDGTGEFEFGDLREVKLKGLTQTYRLYPVEWDAD